MKTLILGLIAAGMAFATTVSAETPGTVGDHWKAFVASPTDANFAVVYADAKACTLPGCVGFEEVSEDMITGLADLVRSQNHNAVRLAMAAENLTALNSDGGDALKDSFGPIIRDNPTFVLAVMQQENYPHNGVVTGTFEDLVYNDTGQVNERMARRAALLTVSDPTLVTLRDAVVTALNDGLAGR